MDIIWKLAMVLAVLFLLYYTLKCIRELSGRRQASVRQTSLQPRAKYRLPRGL